MPLYIGYLDDFKNGTVILLIGDSGAFMRLAEVIESRLGGKLSDLSPDMISVNLTLYLDYGPRACLKRSGNVFCWALSDSEVQEFPSALRSLARSDSPAHAYLDTPIETAKIEVIASIGEYHPTIFTG
jgi:hypothetical protein